MNKSRMLIEELAAGSEVLVMALREADEYWAPNYPPATILLADYARRLVQFSVDPTVPETQRALLIVESAMVSGDLELMTIAATGFIEGLTGCASRQNVLAQFLAALGPKSRFHADAWLAFEARFDRTRHSSA